MYRTDIWTLWEKVRVGCLERTALKHVYFCKLLMIHELETIGLP